jgi:hypothetical protein
MPDDPRSRGQLETGSGARIDQISDIGDLTNISRLHRRNTHKHAVVFCLGMAGHPPYALVCAVRFPPSSGGI